MTMQAIQSRAEASFVDLLASSDQPKRWVERKLAETAQGVIASLRESALSVDQAREDLFNLDNYESIRKRRLHRDLKELFEWGLELGSVKRLVPDSLPESFDAMSRLARRVIEQPTQVASRRLPERGAGGARSRRPKRNRA